MADAANGGGTRGRSHQTEEERAAPSETSVSRRALIRGVSGLAAGTLLSSLLADEQATADPDSKPPEKKTILVIGAHMDDCEIGAGGVIAKAVEKGHRVVLVNVASDYSTWRVTRGREKQLRVRLLAKAREMGVEKRFLDYGYQQVAEAEGHKAALISFCNANAVERTHFELYSRALETLSSRR